jgi:protein-S-isoprenylcysteine O-methyltransferase Ste14
MAELSDVDSGSRPDGRDCTASPLRAMLLALLAIVAADQLLPLSGWPPEPWNLLGLAPLAAGVALASFADLQFKRAGTAVKPFVPASALVTDGVFRVSRNPMYLGLALVLAGAAFLLGSVPALMVAPAYAAWVGSRFIAGEERRLAAQFGDAYSAYRARTRRWI